MLRPDLFDRYDMERRIHERLFCFGSGDADEGSGGGGSENDDGGRQPGDPVVFGVDGVSKTGSTSQDAAIGFTDGSGGRGANFDALQNANRSQTDAAVAAANAAAMAGGDIRAQNAAARSTLNNVSPDAAAERAVAMQNTFGAGAGIAEALGMGPNAASVTPAEEAAMNALVGNNVQANAAASGGSYFTDLSTPRALASQFQAPIDTIDGILSQLDRLEERDRQRRAMFGGQTAADVQALNAQAGEVYFDETTGTYKAGPLPDTRPEAIPSASYFADLSTPRANINNINAAGQNLPPAVITDESGTTFDTTTGEIIESFAGDQDDTDPFAGTGRTAMDLLNYDLDDQSGPAGRIRPFGGLTREQQANLEARDDFVAQRILDAQTAQPSGIPTTNLTGIYTVGDDPMGDVRGFTDFGPTLPFLGPTQVYTGFGENPFAPPEAQDERQTTPPVTNPLTGTSRCPDGFIFDDDLQACRRKTRSELADTGSGGSPAPPTGDIFYRRSILDDAPANLPAGFDFNAANRRFIESYGVRPDNFRMPFSLTGFTRL